MKKQGLVRKVTYHSESFYIFDLEEAADEEYGVPSVTTVRGNLFGIQSLRTGVPISVYGKMVQHPQYGLQMAVKSWEPWMKSPSEFREFLYTSIPGFSYDVAEKLCTKYGDKVEEALNNSDALLKQDLDCNPNDLKKAVLGWDKVKAMCALSEMLQGGGLSVTDIEAAFLRFGQESPTIIKSNPFRLMEIPGFDFTKADRLALLMDIPKDSPLRLEGATLWALGEAAQSEGHLFLSRGAVPDIARRAKTAVHPLPDHNYRDVLKGLGDRGAVRVEEGLGAYLPDYYRYERHTAQMLAAMLQHKDQQALQIDLGSFLAEFKGATQLDLSEAQEKAVHRLVQDRVLVLTGLPGTGKTTCVKALVRLFTAARVSFRLMAPTGVAAKRLSHVTGQPASTIHRALGYDGIEWKHCEGSPLVTDAVIVDEMSMVDMELCYRLLSALRPDTRVVFVGDDAQLPSVGPGNVLRELVNCSKVPHVRLTKIFRQDGLGEIVQNSHKIHHGEFPDLGDPKSTSEFKFVESSDERKIQEVIIRGAKQLKSRDANFQVLAPKYDGLVGVNALNEALRSVLNPEGPREWRGKFQHFREGDRVMVVKNNYQKGVFNGDVGKLLHIGSDQLALRIYGISSRDDAEVYFTTKEADEQLKLAYAITVHRSQGSEFDTVIMPVVSSQGWMLQRNLLYTAVTRAKKTVWLLGQKSAIETAIRNNKVVQRNTALAQVLDGVLEQPREEQSTGGPEA